MDMKVSVNGADFSKEIESISWSGDENQLARKVKITYLYAPRSTPAYTRAAVKGDRITLGGGLFQGIVLNEERSENSVTMSNTAYDYAWYLRSKAFGVYKGSPASVVSQVCGENGIPCGSLYDPGGEVEVISAGEKSISQVIKDAYEGQDVHVFMQGTSLCTEKYGTDLAGTVTGDDYVTDASYTSSAENLVNRVVLLNAQEQPVGEVANGLAEYGTISEAYKVSGDEIDAEKEAEKLLKGVEESGKIVVRGNSAFVTGKAVIVEKVNSKIRGRFVIISDTHEIKDASYITTLGLRFDSVV
ncbi:MAG: hypothetical protein OSJ71_17220 [Acetatifactor sp.]|nr:hypothetical protein [Acetatifactor sp.]